MFEIRVPATTANLGPGFDSLGLALNIYGNFVFEESVHSDTSHLTVRAYQKSLDWLNAKGPNIKVRTTQEIPVARGLGSSAACIVAGVIAAQKLSGKSVSKNDLLQIAAEIEGHPDNVAPAIFGGLISSGVKDGKFFSGALPLSDKISFAVLIPSFTLSTEKSRSALPKNIAHSDATFNLSQLALSISALVNGDTELIRNAFDDRLHQPYRFPLIDEAGEVIKAAKEKGALAAMISGAGPTLLLITEKGCNLEGLSEKLAERKNHWGLKFCNADTEGALLK